jgi:hypothetical protein
MHVLTALSKSVTVAKFMSLNSIHDFRCVHL